MFEGISLLSNGPTEAATGPAQQTGSRKNQETLISVTPLKASGDSEMVLCCPVTDVSRHCENKAWSRLC
jgi:hypothetical protein